MIDAEMYGITFSANRLKRCSAPPENMLNMSTMVPFCAAISCEHRLRVDARHRDVAADAVDDQRADHEQQALAQLGELAEPAEPTLQLRLAPCVAYSPTLPPAASIAALAPAVASTPLSTNFLVSSPFLTILACLASAAPAWRRCSAAKSIVAGVQLVELVQQHFGGVLLHLASGSRPSAGDAASASGRLRSRP